MSAKITRLILIGSSIVALSACTNIKQGWNDIKWPEWTKKSAATTATANCPQASLMPELGNITQLRNGAVLSETIIDSVDTSCTAQDKMAAVRIKVGFKGQLGLQGVRDAVVEANYSIPYLIAVVGPDGNILSKDVFSVSMTYKRGQAEQTYTDILEQLIPVQKQEDAANYKILVGFQLTDEELAYNRARSGQIRPK